MALMLVLGAVLLAALVLAARWRHLSVTLPAGWRPGGAAPSLVAQLRLYLWLATLVLLSGLAVAVLVVGPGGRLAMRLLAATSPGARGRLTEAGEVVGDISLEGTLGFVVFGAVPAGLLAALAHLLLHRALPRGVLGGLCLGAVLLIALGSVLEPLRPDNVDFALLGPGWLAVAVYALLALATGVAAAAFTARLSRLLPLPRWSALVWAPLVLVVTLAMSSARPLDAAAVLLGVAVLLLLGSWLVRSSLVPTRTLVLLLRVGVGVVLVTSLPGFAGAVRDIVA
ncbi:hypothetical protein SAMN04488543_3330 [Friedmanniella luteola]|uniref:Uncharacterized protein n=1 Tax=Friedmanniella luteola TaxID=546871 RepID=A0A1H1YKQ1_9ACTN|nr:hypothetical protein [Friedmanniella luteola]SDT21636.1 hypothetical protein SAMN04488543_3330 [Friedmanniella luteola]